MDLNEKIFTSFEEYFSWKDKNPLVREVELQYDNGILKIKYYIGE